MSCRPASSTEARPIFKQYPMLKGRLPHVPLGLFPTPIEKLRNLSRLIGVEELYVKRDDLSGEVYGGNKVRKLKFLLGDALRRGAREVMTLGCAGSNHALATAIYARQLGLKSISMLTPQLNARYVQLNLLASHYFGAELHYYRGGLHRRLGTVSQLLRHWLRTGRLPYVIPLRGSSPLGTVGFINAAFELREQVEEELLPEPDLVYVAMGTMGTAVGLALGFKAAGLRTRVVAVRVVGEEEASAEKAAKLFNEASRMLSSLDPSFPRLKVSPSDFEVRSEFYGGRYTLFIKEAVRAMKLMHEAEGVKLEATYIGKALAALINDADGGATRGQGGGLLEHLQLKGPFKLRLEGGLPSTASEPTLLLRGARAATR